MSNQMLSGREAGLIADVVRPLFAERKLSGSIYRQRSGFMEIRRLVEGTIDLQLAATHEDLLRQINGIDEDNQIHAQRIDPGTLALMQHATASIRVVLQHTPQTTDVLAPPARVLREVRVPHDSGNDPHTHEEPVVGRIVPNDVSEQQYKRMQHVRTIVRSAVEPINLDAAAVQRAREIGFEVAGDENMEESWRRLELYANTPMVMLIRGESGTGKEPSARAVHAIRSRESQKKIPFVMVNCAALNEGIVESELFGHKKGAFTGATEDRKGKFEEANDGVLFLDEIGDMPLPQQAKLLRVLEQREITRAGSNIPIKINVKVICATNRPLEHLVEKGQFRRDLFERLKACQVALSPWDSRALPHRVQVCRFLIKSLSAEYGVQADVSDEAIIHLLEHSVMGNVRSIRYWIERALVHAMGGTPPYVITPEHLRMAFDGDDNATLSGMNNHEGIRHSQPKAVPDGQVLHVIFPFPLGRSIHEFKRQIVEIVAYHLYQGPADGRVGETAKILGVSRRSVSAYLSKFRDTGVSADAERNEDPSTGAEEVDAI